MTGRNFLIAGCLLVAAILATGCGEDSSLTRGEFSEQADAICVKAEKKREQALEKFLLENEVGFNKPASLKEQEEQVKDVSMPRIRAMTEEVAELDPPSEEEAEIEALIKSVEKGIDKAEENSEKKLKPGPEGFEDPFEDAAERARAYGFKTCYVNY
jgi:hypothetical protein